MAGSSKPSLVSRTSVIGGVIGGLVHGAVAVVLWNVFGLDNLWEMLVLKPLNGGYVVLGMFLLGFVPVLFYVGKKTVSPGIVVAGFLLLSVSGSWLMGPVRAPSAGPIPFGLYILLWVGVIALAGLTGRLEDHHKHRTTR